MRNEIIKELDYLYKIKYKFTELLNELSRIIDHKKGNVPFIEIYNDIIIKYFSVTRKDENE